MKFKVYLLYMLAMLYMVTHATAQNEKKWAYCIKVRQAFWAYDHECWNGKPKFEYTNLTFKGIIKGAPGSYVFPITQPNADLFPRMSEMPEYGTLSDIDVFNMVGNIANDKDTYCGFGGSVLSGGYATCRTDGEDPCNNWFSFSRKGYEQTTHLYVDDPVSVTHYGVKRYNSEGKNIKLYISNFYQNGKTLPMPPTLQVARSNTEDQWCNVQTVTPNQILTLSYADIVPKEKRAEWLGKSLKFRVLKTLLDEMQTYGEIVDGISFYPDGLKFTVEHAKVRACDTMLQLTVRVQDADKYSKYVGIDTNAFYWSIRSDTTRGAQGALRYTCYMQSTTTPGVYNVIPLDVPKGFNPFLASMDKKWYIQLIDKLQPGAFAYTTSFTMPRKPRSITVTQMAPQYNVNGVNYHVPSSNSQFAMLNIQDSDYVSHHRVAYEILYNGVPIASVPEIGKSTYEELNTDDKMQWNMEFDKYCRANPNKVVAAKTAYAQTYGGDWVPPKQLLSHSIGHIAKLEKEAYFLYTKQENGYWNMYMTTLQNGQVLKTRQVTKNENIGYMEIVPDGSACIYERYNTTGIFIVSLLEKQPIQGRLLSSGELSVNLDGTMEHHSNIYFNAKQNRYEVIAAYNKRYHGEGKLGADMYSISIPNGDSNFLFFSYDGRVYVAKDGYCYYVESSGSITKYDAINFRECGGYGKSLPANFNSSYTELTFGLSFIIHDGQSRHQYGRGYSYSETIPYKYTTSYYSYYYSFYYDYDISILAANPDQEVIVVKDAMEIGVNWDQYSKHCDDESRDCEDYSSGDMRNSTALAPNYFMTTSAPSNDGFGQLGISGSIANVKLLPNATEFIFSTGGKTYKYGNASSVLVNNFRSSNIYFSESGDYFLFVDANSKMVYKQYVNPTVVLPEELEPHFWDSYKLQWIAQQLGTKVISDKIALNKDVKWVLKDTDDCEYPYFPVKVTAPPSARWEITNIVKPTTICAKDGSAKIIYRNGGLPPYTYGDKILRNNGDFVMVNDLQYGFNRIDFGTLTGSAGTDTSVVIDGGAGVPVVSVTPQTCATPNGSIKIETSGVGSSKTFYLTKRLGTFDNVETSFTTNASSHTFTNLSSGTYELGITTPAGCSFKTPKAEYNIESQVFAVNSITPINSTTINGFGGAHLTFAHAAPSATCTIGGTPYSIANNEVLIKNLLPKTHTVSIKNGTCSAIDTVISIAKPEAWGSVSISCSKDSCAISGYNVTGNSLFDSYNFHVKSITTNKILYEGKQPNTTIRQHGEYRLSVYSINEEISLYDFSFSANDTIAGSMQEIKVPACPGGEGKASVSVQKAPLSGKVDSVIISFNLLDYTKERKFNLAPSQYAILLRDSKSEKVNNLAITQTYTQPLRFSVPNATPVSAQIEWQHPLCAGAGNGQIWLDSVAGGSGQYQYWINNESRKAVNELSKNLLPGEYSVRIKDVGNNCEEILLGSVTLTDPEKVRIDTMIAHQPTCELENGRIEAKISGGTRWYQKNWYKNATLFDSIDYQRDTSLTHASSLQYGQYKLQVVDGNGCKASSAVTLRQYHNPAVENATTSDVKCYRAANGVVDIQQITTGTSAVDSVKLYHLSLANRHLSKASQPTFTGLDTGHYALYVHDVLGCRSNIPYPVQISEPQEFTIRVDSVHAVPAKGTANGHIAFTLLGGNDSVKNIQLLDINNQPIAYKNERGNMSLWFQNITAGNYTLHARDRKGCTTTSPLLSVAEPADKLGFRITQKQDALCKGQAGVVTVEGWGGWGDYRYKRLVNTSYSTYNIFDKLPAGSYVIHVEDKLGATFSDTIVIHEPKDSLMAQVVQATPPTCKNNGEFQIEVSGGSAPYHLFEGNDTSHIAVSQVVIRNKQAVGQHLFHLVDANGCKFDLGAQLTDTALLHIVDVKCTYPSPAGATNGEIEVITAGGKAPYTYMWSGGDNDTITTTASSITQLKSGDYKVQIVERDGCSTSKLVHLHGSDAAFEVLKVSNETSYEAHNGRAILRSPIGIIKHLTLISPQEQSITLTSLSTTDTIYLQGLSGGSWFAEGENEQAEKVIGEFEVKTYPLFKIANTQVAPVKQPGLSNGGIQVDVAGGGGSNTFLWRNANNDTLPAQNSEYSTLLTDVSAGIYHLLITDIYENTLQISTEVKEPEQALTLTVAERGNESCKGYEDAYVSLKATGGWGEYQFRHDSEKYYAGSSRFDNLSARTHRFYLTDMLGVEDSVDVSITEPEYLRSQVAAVDSVRCKSASDGNITFDLHGGTAPYRLRERDVAPTWTDGLKARGLTQGYHTFVFTDSNSCVCSDTLQVYVPEPDSLLPARIAIAHTLCDKDNGAMQVAMQGGTQPYKYTWKDYTSQTISTDHAIDQLHRGGVYTLHITDRYGCAYTITRHINPSTNPTVDSLRITSVLCYSDTTGTATITHLTPATPIAPYTLTWSNSDTGYMSPHFSYGRHSVTIADTNGCSTTTFFDVNQPDSLHMTLLSAKEPHCFGYSDAHIHTVPLGGVQGYHYVWSTGDSTPHLDSIHMGKYSLTLSDRNGCTYQRAFTINQPDMLHVNVGPDITICPGSTYTINGQSYTAFSWYTHSAEVSREQYFTVDTAGTYYLRTTDARGCHAYDTINVAMGADALRADFLLSSEATLGDTLMLFELSNMPLDSLHWQYSATGFVDIGDDEHKKMEYLLVLWPQQAGEHTIGLYAYSGGCFSYIAKTVNVQSQIPTEPNASTLGYKEPLIQVFKVYPNPSSGEFTTEVLLREETDIRLSLFSLNSSSRMDDRRASGLSKYSIDYRLASLPPGVYILLLNAGSEHKQVKIIKK